MGRWVNVVNFNKTTCKQRDVALLCIKVVVKKNKKNIGIIMDHESADGSSQSLLGRFYVHDQVLHARINF